MTAVRPATADDAEGVAQVHVDSWRATYRGQMPDAVLDALSVADRARGWRERLTDAHANPRRTWVVEDPGGVRGFASAGPSRDADAGERTGELLAIYVAPDALGRGYGRALLARALDDLRGRGYTEVTLWVLPGNARARRFYEAAGMRADGGAKVETVGGAALPHVRYRLTLGART